MRTRSVAWISCLVLALGLAGTHARAGTISLRWDPVPGAAGYRVYYGTSPGAYTGSITVGSTTQATIQDLENCREHHVAVKAFNGAGESEAFSNEVSGWPRPEVTQIQPRPVIQGGYVTMDILGANFEPGASIVWDAAAIPTDFSGAPLVRFLEVNVTSCDRIEVFLNVESPARGARAMELGNHQLPFEILNPDSVFGAAQAVLEVRFNLYRADINRDNTITVDRVDGLDLAWLGYAHGSAEGAPTYNPDADLTGDGLIDGEDLALLAPYFGLCWEPSTYSWQLDACPE